MKCEWDKDCKDEVVWENFNVPQGSRINPEGFKSFFYCDHHASVIHSDTRLNCGEWRNAPQLLKPGKPVIDQESVIPKE